MNINEDQIKDLVKEVLNRVSTGDLKKPTGISGNSLYGVYDDVKRALDETLVAQKKVCKMTFEEREKIINNIREKTLENAEIFAQMGVEETKMGNVEHKILKHELLANKTPGTEDITTTAWSGDNGLTLIERGPFGVIGAVTPSTNPSETIICNTIGMLAGGNTVIFNPHPSAKNVSNFAVDMINRASIEVGGPNNIAVSISNPTLESGEFIFKNPNIPCLVATGGPGVVNIILSSGKRGFGAGAGNPPVLVDETADIKKAAKDIVDGATFDNNLPCIAEKEIIAISKICDELIFYLKENDCYYADQNEINKIMELVLVEKNGKTTLNRNYVGASAEKILTDAGINFNKKVRCIIFEGDKDHKLIYEELMMPILGIVRVNNFEQGVKAAKYLEQGNGHSAHIHSKNIDNLTTYGREIDTAIFVKNGPSYNALGFGGEGFCTFTIASKTGDGLTSAMSFTKARRCVMSDSLCIR